VYSNILEIIADQQERQTDLEDNGGSCQRFTVEGPELDAALTRLDEQFEGGR